MLKTTEFDNPDSLVVTDEDYIDFVLRISAEGEINHAVPQTFRYRLSLWPTLFVGYRLMDLMLRLLFRTLRWKLDQSILQAVIRSMWLRIGLCAR